jgi:hypothetical protein
MVCVKQKSLSLSFIFSVASWGGQTSSKAAAAYSWQSLLGLDYSLNCTNISANCTAIAVFFIPTEPEGGYKVFLQEKCPFLLLI